ncbi:MAG TPA: hypothetical protein DGF30_01940 [Desulfomicrobium sp.]|nr:hypothetical protein [Desulfomicrobium sp.]
MLDTITLIPLLKGLYNIGTDCIDRYSKWKQLGDDVDAKIRLLYLECRRNLALLDCLRMEKGRMTGTESAALLKIIPLLDTSIIEMAFMDDQKGKKLFELLNKEVDLKLTEERTIKSEKQAGKIKRRQTRIKVAMHIYTSVKVLEGLNRLNTDGKMLKRLDYKKRISNIKAAYVCLVKSLHEESAINTLDDLKSEPYFDKLRGL